MKKILLIGCLLCANLQAQTYQFESATAASSGGSGISVAQAREATGWTSNGTTTAQDTLATYYLINGKYQRQMWVDTDNDSVIIAPHSITPFIFKDGTTIHAQIDSSGRIGIGGSTNAQNSRAFLNVIGFGDTIATFIGDADKALGDSSIYVTSGGRMSIKGATFAHTNVALSVNGYVQSSFGMLVQNNTGIESFSTGAGITLRETNKSILARVASSGGFSVGRASNILSQGLITVNGRGQSDTLAVFRNDIDATLDSTAMVFANGDLYAGGNNFYLGEWRIRVGADSLVFHHEGTQVFAILPDGTTADLVAGVPPNLWHNGPPQEYIWLLRLGVFLLLLLVASKVYDYAKPKIRKHRTLSGEI